MRVILIEDDPHTRTALERVICELSGFCLEASAGSHALGRGLLTTPFDVMLVDIQLGDGSGIDLIREVRTIHGDAVKILTISALGDEASVVAALEAGADGYVLKDAPDLEVSQAIRSVSAGHAPISPGVARHLLRRFRGPAPDARSEAGGLHLSPRERQILEALAQGLSYKETAVRLEISYHTVTDYVKSLYRKLKVSSRSKAVAKAARSGLVDLDTLRT